RPLRIAELELGVLLELGEVLEDLLPQPLGPLPPGAVVVRPCLRGDREAWRHRDAEGGQLGQLATLAAQQVAHQGGAFRLAATKRVDEFGHAMPRLRAGASKKSFKPTG